MLRENRNILEPIILITLQKLFGKKLCIDLNFATNFWERKNESKIAYNKQQNICLSLLHKTKWSYLSNMDTKIMKDNRKFWKTVNPLISKKSYWKQSISLISKDGLITKNEDLAKTFDIFFSNIVNKLGIRGGSRTNMWVQQVSLWKNVGHHGWPTEKIFDFRWAKTVLKCISSP